MPGLDGPRALLDLEPVDGESWFLVTEKALGFAPQKDGRRPVILRQSGSGPLATVYPRTTRPNAHAPESPSHDHREQYPRCCISKDGWVLTGIPKTIARDDLGEPRCREQHAATLEAVRTGRP